MNKRPKKSRKQKVRVYCYRKNGSFKIWIDLFLSLFPDGRVSVKSLKFVRSKIKEVNIQNQYYAWNKIRGIKVNAFNYYL